MRLSNGDVLLACPLDDTVLKAVETIEQDAAAHVSEV